MYTLGGRQRDEFLELTSPPLNYAEYWLRYQTVYRVYEEFLADALSRVLLTEEMTDAVGARDTAIQDIATILREWQGRSPKARLKIMDVFKRRRQMDDRLAGLVKAVDPSFSFLEEEFFLSQRLAKFRHSSAKPEMGYTQLALEMMEPLLTDRQLLLAEFRSIAEADVREVVAETVGRLHRLLEHHMEAASTYPSLYRKLSALEGREPLVERLREAIEGDAPIEALFMEALETTVEERLAVREGAGEKRRRTHALRLYLDKQRGRLISEGRKEAVVDLDLRVRVLTSYLDQW
jgi:hypothetical protein